MVDLRQKLMKPRPKASQVRTASTWVPESEVEEARARHKVERLVSPAKPKAPPPGRRGYQEEPSSSSLPSVMDDFLPRFLKIRKMFCLKRTPEVAKRISDALHALNDNVILPGLDDITLLVGSQEDPKV